MTQEQECLIILSLMQEPEMEGEHTWLLRTITLGPNNIGYIAATAEHMLINATYRGERMTLGF